MGVYSITASTAIAGRYLYMCIVKISQRPLFTALSAIALRLHLVSCGPAKIMFKPRIRHVLINCTSFYLMCLDGVVHALVDALSVGSMVF